MKQEYSCPNTQDMLSNLSVQKQYRCGVLKFCLLATQWHMGFNAIWE